MQPKTCIQKIPSTICTYVRVYEHMYASSLSLSLARRMLARGCSRRCSLVSSGWLVCVCVCGLVYALVRLSPLRRFQFAHEARIVKKPWIRKRYNFKHLIYAFKKLQKEKCFDFGIAVSKQNCDIGSILKATTTIKATNLK